jgi:hypothetical protein
LPFGGAVDEAGELSDEALNSAAQNSMSAAEILGMRRQNEQFQQQIALQRQNAAYARDPESAPVSDAQRRGLTNDYNRAVSGAMDDLGILRPSLPYARLAVTNNGDTTNIEGVNSRSSDVALLRAAARAQTGPGVLTESEVFSTLSPSLQQALVRNVAYLDISQNGITPQDRLALAQFVMQSSRNVQLARRLVQPIVVFPHLLDAECAGLGMLAHCLVHPNRLTLDRKDPRRRAGRCVTTA